LQRGGYGGLGLDEEEEWMAMVGLDEEEEQTKKKKNEEGVRLSEKNARGQRLPFL
jgi:hypothetical protein